MFIYITGSIVAAGLLWTVSRAYRSRTAIQAMQKHLPPAKYYSWQVWTAETSSKSVLPALPETAATVESGTRLNAHTDITQANPEVRFPGMEIWPAGLDGILAGIAPAVAFASIDANVVAALDFSAKEDLSNFSRLKVAVEHAQAMDPDSYAGWFTRLKGYVGEQVAADVLESRGFDVAFAELANQPGWDLMVDGIPYNVKVGEQTGHILEHMERYPDIDVITSTELASQLPADLQDRVLALDELSNDAVTELTDQTLEGITEVDVGLQIPIITVALSSIREGTLLYNRHTDYSTALKNVGLDAAGTGLGSWAGAKGGAAIGTLIAPGIGTVIGTIVGAVGGAMAGRAITNEIKMAAFKRAMETYQMAAEKGRADATQAHTFAVERIRSQITQTEAILRQDMERIHQEHRRPMLGARDGFIRTAGAFARQLPKILQQAETVLADEQEQVLARMERSSTLRRALWPTRADLEYRAVELWFQRQRRELEAAAEWMPEKLAGMNDEEAFNYVKAWLEEKVFNLREMEEAVRTVADEHRRTLNRCQIERTLAAREAKASFIRRTDGLQRFMADQVKHLGDQVQAIAARVAPLREAAMTEARKIGYKV